MVTTKTTVTEVHEKKCQLCGRVGTRAFVQAIPGGPSWMGPWKCRWEYACQDREEAARPPTVVVGAVDLDAMHEEGFSDE